MSKYVVEYYEAVVQSSHLQANIFGVQQVTRRYLKDLEIRFNLSVESVPMRMVVNGITYKLASRNCVNKYGICPVNITKYA